MTECRRQRCDREAERASLADGQCILHFQKYKTKQPAIAAPEPVEDTDED